MLRCKIKQHQEALAMKVALAPGYRNRMLALLPTTRSAVGAQLEVAAKHRWRWT
jgi:hypothetical protein